LADDEMCKIPMDLFQNNEVKYPPDVNHLLVETHPSYEVFSPSGYMEIRYRTWCTKYNTIRTTIQEVTKYAVATQGH
jgi:hypothetical protein